MTHEPAQQSPPKKTHRQSIDEMIEQNAASRERVMEIIAELRWIAKQMRKNDPRQV